MSLDSKKGNIFSMSPFHVKIHKSMLPWKDSNSHKRNQNPVCYHYTTRQCFSPSLRTVSGLFPFDTAKLVLIFDSTKFSTLFFYFFSNFFLQCSRENGQFSSYHSVGVDVEPPGASPRDL